MPGLLIPPIWSWLTTSVPLGEISLMELFPPSAIHAFPLESVAILLGAKQHTGRMAVPSAAICVTVLSPVPVDAPLPPAGQPVSHAFAIQRPPEASAAIPTGKLTLLT